MWQSEADIVNDLAALNDFGDPGNTEPCKVLYSFGRGSKPKKTTSFQTLVDSRTGEKIDSGDQCLEDFFYKGKGRGAVLGGRSSSLLQKQLRLVKPLGSSDKIIEDYCRRNEQVEDSSTLPNFPSTRILKNTDNISSKETKFRIKAVRRSNLANNALITGLLKTKEVALPYPEKEKSKVAEESDITRESNGVSSFNYKYEETGKCEISQTDSNWEDSFSLNTSEEATSESLSDFFKSSNKQKRFEEKGIKHENSQRISIDLIENFNLIYSKEDELSNAHENDIESSVIDSENHDRHKMYKKLGERMNRMKLYADPKNRNDSFSKKNPEQGVNSLELQNKTDEFVFKEVDFPSLVKKKY